MTPPATEVTPEHQGGHHRSGKQDQTSINHTFLGEAHRLGWFKRRQGPAASQPPQHVTEYQQLYDHKDDRTASAELVAGFIHAQEVYFSQSKEGGTNPKVGPSVSK